MEKEGERPRERGVSGRRKLNKRDRGRQRSGNNHTDAHTHMSSNIDGIVCRYTHYIYSYIYICEKRGRVREKDSGCEEGKEKDSGCEEGKEKER